MDMNIVKRLAVLIISLTIPLSLSPVYGQPFWTEKSSYLEGEYLYTVGLATNAKTKEIGRELAFEHGKQEISNFVQLINLTGIEILTQMTYEKENDVGTYNVYRLLRVEYPQLMELKEKQLNISKIHLKYLAKQQEKEIDIKKTALATAKKNIEKIKAIDKEYNAILKRINNLSDNATKYVKIGMTIDDVEIVLGKAQRTDRCADTLYYNYGKYWIVFNSGIVTCLKKPGTYGNCCSCNRYDYYPID